MKYTISLFAVLVIAVLSAVGVDAVVDTITVRDKHTPEVKFMLLFKDLGISGYEHAQSVEILKDLVFAKQNNNQ